MSWIPSDKLFVSPGSISSTCTCPKFTKALRPPLRDAPPPICSPWKLSTYQEMALSREWMEKKEKKMVLQDCSIEALNVAVNFMYGMNVPEDFTQYGDLLHLAELFMMENLKEVVVERLANNLSKGNYLETSKTAE